MKIFYKNLLVFFFLFNVSVLSGQTTIGYPFIKNYKHSEYHSGRQSCMISQAPDELMYFANNEGLLEFDGLNWNLYSLPNWTILRSVLADIAGRIYVGADNNFGYFEKNKSGKLVFHSLLDLLNGAKQKYNEIWRIYKTSDGIVFQSYKNLIVFKNNVLKIYPAPAEFHFSFLVKNKLYLHDTKNGIYEFKNQEFVLLKGTESLVNKEICAIIELKQTLLIATTNNGIFKYENNQLSTWENNSSEFFIKNQIYSVLRIDNDRIAFGTIQNGVLITNNQGVPIYHLNENSGIQNNTVLSMFLDVDKNLWLATDNGIDLIYIHSPLRQLNKQQGLSSGYSAAVHNDKLYLATN
jgi:ligand-binding sensor domain-containing protein